MSNKTQLPPLNANDLTGDAYRLNRNFKLILDLIDEVRGTVATTTPTVSGGGGGGGTDTSTADLLLDMALTDSLTTVTSPGTARDGRLLTVILRQNASGERRISWSGVYGGASADIGTDAGTYTAYRFVGVGSRWVLSAVPVTNIPDGPGTPGTTKSASPNLLMDLTLVGDTPIPSPSSPAPAQRLAVILRQDGTGGHAVTWDSTFTGAPTDIENAANTVTVMEYIGSGGFWVLASMPVTGVILGGTPGSGGQGTDANLLQQVTLPGGVTTTVDPPGAPADAQRITVALSQQGNGLVDWGSGYTPLVTDIDPTAGTLSVFPYVGSNGAWILCSQPATGVIV